MMTRSSEEISRHDTPGMESAQSGSGRARRTCHYYTRTFHSAALDTHPVSSIPKHTDFTPCPSPFYSSPTRPVKTAQTPEEALATGLIFKAEKVAKLTVQVTGAAAKFVITETKSFRNWAPEKMDTIFNDVSAAIDKLSDASRKMGRDIRAATKKLPDKMEELPGKITDKCRVSGGIQGKVIEAFRTSSILAKTHQSAAIQVGALQVGQFACRDEKIKAQTAGKPTVPQAGKVRDRGRLYGLYEET